MSSFGSRFQMNIHEKPVNSENVLEVLKTFPIHTETTVKKKHKRGDDDDDDDEKLDFKNVLNPTDDELLCDEFNRVEVIDESISKIKVKRTSGKQKFSSRYKNLPIADKKSKKTF